MNESTEIYRSEDELRVLAEGFEDCSLSPDAFDHRAHLAVAIWYLSSLTMEQAGNRVREGLLRFLAHYEVDPTKYNETITQFWVRRLDSLLNEITGTLPLAERANLAIERAGDSGVIFDYYTRERIFSEEGRLSWIEPDLKPLDF